jgi:phosphorylase kinase alpha/beta subunit
MFETLYVEASIKGLNSSRIKDGLGRGLFSATEFDPSKCRTQVTSGDSTENDDNYSLSWVRDTIKCSFYDLIVGNNSQVQNTLDTLLTYFKINTKILNQTIEASSKGEKLKFDQHAIMPRMHPLTLEGVHADQKKDLQLDMAEILKYLALAIQNKIWLPKDVEDVLLVQKIVEYFLAWNYSLNADTPGDFGVWEEGKNGTNGTLEPEIHASSIAAILAGFIHIQGLTLQIEDTETVVVHIDENVINEGFDLLNERISIVGETEERPCDLTSLIILYDHLVLIEMGKRILLTQENIQKILENFSKLERSRGFLRYSSDENPNALDDYHKSGSPEKKSAEWTMGFGYAALIYEKLGLHQKAVEYIEKMESTFDWDKKLGLPEAYFGGTDQPVPISPLSWSNALYLIAYETMRQK